jgi:hypothetical protein
METTCGKCHKPMTPRGIPGNQRRYCSDVCRVRAYQIRQLEKRRAALASPSIDRSDSADKKKAGSARN